MHTPDDRHNNQVHDQVRQRNGMSDNVSRAITWSVQLRSNDRTNVTDGNLHCIGCRALRLTADINGRPGETECDRWVDSGGGEEGANVRDSRLLSWVNVAEENTVADYSNRCGEKEGWAAASVALGNDGVDDGESGGKGL